MLFQVVESALMIGNYKKVDQVQYKHILTTERATLPMSKLPGNEHLLQDTEQG